MGVDARMLVRHRGEPLTDHRIRSIAGDLLSRFGHQNFYFRREANPFGPARHALSLVRTAAEYRAEWGEDADIPESLPADRQIWTQNGDDIVSEPGEQFIQVHFYTCYYGEGYERGDWPLIKGVAEFLEHAIPGCEVWYGGDSSGICAERFGHTERERLHRHFLEHGHTPYRSYLVRSNQTCEFCGGRAMIDTGGGRGRTFFSCDGCGLKRIVTPSGAFDLQEGQDFFAWEPPPAAEPANA